jgi:hypothetical protein
MALEDLTSIDSLSSLAENVRPFLTSNTYLIPIIALLGVRLLFGTIFRSGIGLLGIFALVLLMLGSDPQVVEMFGEGLGGSHLKEFTKLNYTTAALLGLGLLLLLRGTRIGMGSIVLLALVGYLVLNRDFSAQTFQLKGGQFRILITAAVIGLIALLLRSQRFRNPYRYQNFYRPFWTFEKTQPLFMLLTLSLAALFMYNPPLLETTMPGWRMNVGLGTLAASGVGLLYTLPATARRYAFARSPVPCAWGINDIGFLIHKD